MSDNTLTTPYNISNLRTTNTFNQIAGGVGQVDYYEFSVLNTSTINLLLSGITVNSVEASIIYDRNNNRLLDSGERLYSDTGFPSNNGTINTTLGAGNYFIEVKPSTSPNNNSYSGYSLEVGAVPTPASILSDPGNTLNSAYNVGNFNGTRTYKEFVGVVDPLDYYKFSLAGTSQISVLLSGVTESGLKTSIISDANNNGIIDGGERLFTDTTEVNNNGTINATLAAGNYLISVEPDSANINSNYSLSLSNLTIATPNAAKDFNKDRQTDILLTNPSQGLNQAWLMDGTNYAGVINIVGSPGYRPVATADFNKDGKTDLIASNPTNNFNVVWFLDGANYLDGVGLPIAAGWEIKGAADFNNDGNVDILLNNTTTNWNTVWFLGGANGATYTGYGNLPVANGWDITGVADFNADGKADILLNNPTQGWNSVWFLNGTDYIGFANLPSAPGWQSLGTGDFNSDGKPDIIMNNITQGWNSIWLMDGTNYTGFANLPNAPAGSEIAGMA
ncbi:MAG TPA: VCBS repeat-containing protein [Nodularia sp. (in: cyanobacteria)]|nr:VCBS repeat-containing protein [Nodularia sp. (in: cyanobacteria)]